MSTYTQIIYQIVFGTKYREKVLQASGRPELFRYIAGLIKNKGCHLYRINGVEDHLHIVTHLHPSISLASLVKDIKLASSDHIRKSGLFPNFNGWQNGYGAFTYSIKEKKRVIEYVKDQEGRHRIKSFREEYIELLQEHSIEFEDKYLI